MSFINITNAINPATTLAPGMGEAAIKAHIPNPVNVPMPIVTEISCVMSPNISPPVKDNPSLKVNSIPPVKKV